ncbi:hypothetical protein IV203_034869 [Nitzschia inconspicua]|uniref:Uncharacterized protein n=1 Tax=Nitzschia inconspicua TaxID=303405 RepID=A0A9K3PUD1_9STRA|nr:hypothetical protein IV203_034869 [Nitzschia inconspicua]
MDLTIASGSVRSSNVPGKKDKRKKRSTRPRNDQRFADYIVFGLQATWCLGLFVICYAIVLIILWPLLKASTSKSSTNEGPPDVIKHVPLQKITHTDEQNKWGEMASTVRKRLQQFRLGRGVTDAQLLDEAAAEFESRRKQHQEALAQVAAQQKEQDEADKKNAKAAEGHERNGFVVLGMHRSGTSMLAGLLHQSAGYQVGGPLIGSAFDNEKGFFERVDIVLQNDEFMAKQGIWWSANVINYDWEKAIKDIEDGIVKFTKGKPGLKFLDDPKNAPWLQKDPRMCITLKTWVALMKTEPAVLFTYRHPLEVALSLHKREKNFPLERGLRLWIVYNMRAIQNSKGLCMVTSSNDAILADPVREIQRISDELTYTCGVPEPPDRIKQEDVDEFIDPKLQHGRKELSKEEKRVLETYNNGECKVYSYTSEEEEGSAEFRREHEIYQLAMKIYCDFQSGEAYKDDYKWPRI